jgi:hypothetical protein
LAPHKYFQTNFKNRTPKLLTPYSLKLTTINTTIIIMTNTTTDTTAQKVIVFGSTGPIGTHLVGKMSKEQPSWKIYAVTRSSGGDNRFSHLPNVQVVQGDINVKNEAMTLSADKDIVYSCVGFARYEAKYWAKHWPIVIDNILSASSQTSHQKLVFCNNLYAYGATQNISPSSTIVPAGKKTKPAVRAMIRKDLQKRMDERPESITVVGGADFFGPLVTSKQTNKLNDY